MSPRLRFPEFNDEWTMMEAETLFDNIVVKNCPHETVLTIIQGKGTVPRNEAGRNIHYDEQYLSNYKFVNKDDYIIHLRSFEGGFELANSCGIVSPAYTILRCKKPFAPIFYDAYFHTNEFINHVLYKAVEGIRDGRQISYEAFKWLKIPYCSKTEQDKIAGLLQVINMRIAKQQEIIECFKSYKRGLSIAIFDKKSLITNSTIRTVTLGSFCNIIMGQSPDSASYNTEGVGLPLVQGNADMKNGITTPTKYTSNPTKTCDAGEIILSVRAPVGSVGVSNQKICLGRGVCSISSPNNDYILQYLKHCEKQWRTLEQGGTFTAISGDDIKNFPLMLPNDTEIENIVRLLKGLDNLISRQELQLEKLIYCKQGLLQSLFI